MCIRDSPRIELRPGLYPLFLGALLVFFGLILLWQGRSALRKGAATVQFPQEVLRPSMLFLAMIAYRAALPYLGFVISTLVFLFTIVQMCIRDRVSTDPEVKVVILKGAGKSFSAGSDVNEFLKDDIAALRAHFRVVAEVFKGMSECKKLIIAAVQGYALGGGCGLTAAADFAIASVDAQFGLPEVDLDIFPMTIMPPIVRAVSMRKALELLFLGERVNACLLYTSRCV